MGDSHHIPVPVAAGTQQAMELRLQRPQVVQTGPSSHDADDSGIDLLEYWHIILKRRWTVLGMLGIVLAVVLVVTLLTPSIFRSSTTLQIERDTIQVVQVQGLMPVESVSDKDFYQTQYELLKSRTLAKRVIDQLNLGSDPSFARLRERTPLGRLIDML